MKFEIKGGSFPVVECRLNRGEVMITEKGGMAWMSKDLAFNTSTGGGFLKGLGRSFSGESMFLNYYTAKSDNQVIAFGSCFPGMIMPIELTGNNSIIAQKKAFLACEQNVNLDIHFTKRFGAGFFGGEGFILQKLSGTGMAFLEIDGQVVEYDLKPGEEMLIDQGYLAAMEPSVSFDIERIKGMKNILFGGEGLFVGHLTGPGKIWLQTMPLATLANEIIAKVPSN